MRRAREDRHAVLTSKAYQPELIMRYVILAKRPNISMLR